MPGNRKSQFPTFVLLPGPYFSLGLVDPMYGVGVGVGGVFLSFLNWISSLYFHFPLCYVPNGRVSAI